MIFVTNSRFESQCYVYMVTYRPFCCFLKLSFDIFCFLYSLSVYEKSSFYDQISQEGISTAHKFFSLHMVLLRKWCWFLFKKYFSFLKNVFLFLKFFFLNLPKKRKKNKFVQWPQEDCQGKPTWNNRGNEVKMVSTRTFVILRSTWWMPLIQQFSRASVICCTIRNPWTSPMGFFSPLCRRSNKSSSILGNRRVTSCLPFRINERGFKSVEMSSWILQAIKEKRRWTQPRRPQYRIFAECNPHTKN